MSNMPNIHPVLAFAVGHISTKLHQFLISSFRDFLQTDTQTDAAKNNTCPQHSWRAGKNRSRVLIVAGKSILARLKLSIEKWSNSHVSITFVLSCRVSFYKKEL